jgi:hypothetical protein
MLDPECNHGNPPSDKFCGLCGDLARSEGRWAGRGSRGQALMAGVGNSATVANALLPIQYAVQALH